MRKIIIGAILASIIVLVLLGAGATLLYLNKGEQGIQLPSYTKASPLISEAYMFAVESPQALDGVNCYCGCMQHLHDGRIHKRGLLDCYLTEDGKFEPHASACDMCIRDALEVKEMYEQGMNKEEIMQKIDEKYLT